MFTARTIPALALLLLAVPAFAATQEENCGVYGQLATKVMEWRQSGSDMQKLLVATGAASDPVMKAIILNAYEVRQYDTAEYQQRAIAEFANDMTLSCYKSGIATN